MPSTPRTRPSRRLWLAMRLPPYMKERSRNSGSTAESARAARCRASPCRAPSSLAGVGQAGGVAEVVLVMPSARALAVIMRANSASRAAEIFADRHRHVVGRFGDQRVMAVSTVIVSPAGRPAWSAAARRRGPRPASASPWCSGRCSKRLEQSDRASSSWSARPDSAARRRSANRVLPVLASTTMAANLPAPRCLRPPRRG